MRWLWSVVVLAGCSVALEDWGRAAGQARCERAQRCRGLSWSIDCSRPGIWSDTPLELIAFEAKEVGYSPTSAAACLERLEKDPCNDVVDKTPECRAAFPGRLPEGAPCGYPMFDNCGPGLRCRRESSLDACGTCAPLTPIGETLIDRRPCDWGSASRMVLDAGAPHVVCQPRAGVGEPCTHQLCLEWLVCSGPTAAERKCIAGDPLPSAPPPDASIPGEVGQPCTAPNYSTSQGLRCRGGLRCVGEVCTAIGQFEDPCTRDDDCLSHHCARDLCDRVRAPGDSCAQGDVCGEWSGCATYADGGGSCQTFPLPWCP